MEIFSDNIDSIKRELELIKDSFIKTNFKRFIIKKFLGYIMKAESVKITDNVY